MALYLIDKSFGADGLELAAQDRDAHIVLIQDGVYLDVSKLSGRPVYAVAADVDRRGLGERLAGWIKRIDYPELVDLIVKHKVYNFA